MPRVAAIDCGTNSVRLLVADVERDPGTGAVRQVDVDRRMEVVRLGQGVDATGRLDPQALQRTFAAVERYAGVVEAAGAEAVRFVATSATRDAANAGEFVAGVRDRVGVLPEVVSGDEEAALSFAGATASLPAGLAGPYGVVDVGGGSTEVVVGPGGAGHGFPASLAARSVDVGCVRLFERHLRDDPPAGGQVAAARADVEAALDDVAAAVPLAEVRTLVGVAGTVTTITAALLDLPAYDPVAIHGSVHPVADVVATCRRILATPRDERAAWPFMHPGRVDVVGAGALVWSAVVERVAAASGITTVVTSEHDILDGIAASLVPAAASPAGSPASAAPA